MALLPICSGDCRLGKKEMRGGYCVVWRGIKRSHIKVDDFWLWLLVTVYTVCTEVCLFSSLWTFLSCNPLLLRVLYEFCPLPPPPQPRLSAYFDRNSPVPGSKYSVSKAVSRWCVNPLPPPRRFLASAGMYPTRPVPRRSQIEYLGYLLTLSLSLTRVAFSFT